MSSRRSLFGRIRVCLRRRLSFHLNLREEPTERLARAVGVGVSVSFLPTIGFQPVAALFLAILLNANKLLAISVTVISNPLTFFPIYYPAYRLGSRITGVAPREQAVRNLFDLSAGWGRFLTEGYELWWQVFLPVFVGSIPIALVFGGVTYLVTRILIDRCRAPTR